jgi:hypothetical protein
MRLKLWIEVQFLWDHLLRLSFSYLITFVPFSKSIGHLIWVSFGVLYSVPMIYMSIPSPIPNSLDYCSYILEFLNFNNSYLYNNELGFAITFICYKFTMSWLIYSTNIYWAYFLPCASDTSWKRWRWIPEFYGLSSGKKSAYN